MAVDITPKKDGGVLKEILTPGEGIDTPPAGCKVKAHYHGTLTDGTVFDSSVERGEPFEFTLGQGQVIKAWDLGVATMKKGEKARLTCQAKYAYGDAGSPPKIPGGATLVFDITLLSWQEEDLTENNDGGVLRAILKQGEGYANPAEFCLCKAKLRGTYEGQVYDERELSFMLGEGAEHNIPLGVEIALQKMKKGELARITLAPKYGWEGGHPEFGLPPGATLRYEVELLEFEKDKEAWDMDADEKLEQATFLKNKATEYFQKLKFQIASKLYGKAASYVESTQGEGFTASQEEERKKILLAIRLNLGLVHLKMSQPYEAKQACDKVLELDGNNVKGLFRRGQAFLAMAEPDAAKADFERVLQLEPSNNAAIAQISACKKKIAEIRAKEKQIYSNMFEKFARKDKEAYHYGWWDDAGKSPVVSEKLEIPEEKEEIEERKREKKKQLEHLKKLAEARRKEREEEQKGEEKKDEENEKNLPGEEAAEELDCQVSQNEALKDNLPCENTENDKTEQVPLEKPEVNITNKIP